MLRLKKFHLFILIVIFTVIFFMIQLMFNFKISLNHFKNDKYMKNNPRFDVWSKKPKNSEKNIQKQNQINNFKKVFKKVMKNELIIPLDSNKQPYLFHMLPFYHRINYANFSHAMVESLVQVDDFSKLINTTQVTFVNIEEENRIKNMAVLKDSDLVQLPISENKQDLNYIRGVKIDELHLYRPDADGLFKCIDSNVILSRIFIH
jgi:hypothetical protein